MKLEHYRTVSYQAVGSFWGERGYITCTRGGEDGNQSSSSSSVWYLRSKRQAAPDTFRSSVHPANEVVPHLQRQTNTPFNFTLLPTVLAMYTQR